MDEIKNRLFTVFDIETNGLLDNVDKIHCLSYHTFKILPNFNIKTINKGSLIDYNTINTFFTNIIKQNHFIIGHNIIKYDLPVLEKLIPNIFTNQPNIIDTLGLSWYLNIGSKHNLEYYGNTFNIPKIIIKNWDNLQLEDYVNRCETDVLINTKLFIYQLKKLLPLYESFENTQKIINYINFKLTCLKEQEKYPVFINNNLIETSIEELSKIQEEKHLVLKEAMPLQYKYKKIKKPSNMYKKDNSLSSKGLNFINLCNENNIDPNTDSFNIVESTNKGNPNSKSQLKDWLYLLGWEPITYSEVKNVKGIISKVPQIYNEKKEVCNSIKELYKKEPSLKALESLSLINHRLGILKAFKENMKYNPNANSYTINSDAFGFTNTFRLRHRVPLVNLPKPHLFYGDKIRGSIIAPNNYLMCGNDMSALEDTTKQHLMYFYDKEYVLQMRTPGFDPHIDIAVFTNLMTQEEANTFKKLKKLENPSEEQKLEYSRLNIIRSKAKTINFGGVYGIGAVKLAENLNIPLEEAKKLHQGYWEKNKAVKQVSNNCIVKIFLKNNIIIKDKVSKIEYLLKNNEIQESQIIKMYVQNPVSLFWHELRYLKDVFSSVNQGLGVYCFDTYIKKVRKKGIKISFQYHDEIMFIFPINNKDKIKQLLNEAIEETNQQLKLNVPLAISIDIGNNYAEVH